MYKHRDRGIDVGDGPFVARLWSFASQFFGLAIDAFATGSLEATFKQQKRMFDEKASELAGGGHALPWLQHILAR